MTSKLKGGIGDVGRLERVSARVDAPGDARRVFLKYGFTVETAMPLDFSRKLGRCGKRLKPCVVSIVGGNDGAVQGRGWVDVACKGISALTIELLSSDPDMPLSSSKTLAVVVESEGEEHQELVCSKDVDNAASSGGRRSG